MSHDHALCSRILSPIADARDGQASSKTAQLEEAQTRVRSLEEAMAQADGDAVAAAAVRANESAQALSLAVAEARAEEAVKLAAVENEARTAAEEAAEALADKDQEVVQLRTRVHDLAQEKQACHDFCRASKFVTCHANTVA